MSKKQLRSFVRYEEAQRRNDLRQMENYFYACIYDVLRSHMPQEDKMARTRKIRSEGSKDTYRRTEYSTVIK